MLNTSNQLIVQGLELQLLQVHTIPFMLTDICRKFESRYLFTDDQIIAHGKDV